MLKWIIPAAMAVSIIGAVAEPVSAQIPDRYYQNRDRDRDYRDRDYRDRDYRTRDYRTRNVNGGRRDEVITRIQQIRDRARRLRDNGRLSQDHYERTVVKFDRIRDDLREGNRFTDSEYRTNMQRLDDIEETMNRWADSNGNRRIDRTRRIYR